jgi:hypothetical protein
LERLPIRSSADFTRLTSGAVPLSKRQALIRADLRQYPTVDLDIGVHGANGSGLCWPPDGVARTAGAVSLVVPLTRRLLWFIPPPCVQFQGRAEVLEQDDPGGVETFRSFAMVRRVLGMYEDMARKGESGVCFLRITPDPTLSTYTWSGTPCGS